MCTFSLPTFRLFNKTAGCRRHTHHNTQHYSWFLISYFSYSLIFFIADENNSLSQTIPDKPIELHHFVKLCEQRRKFPVLYKLEFQVSRNLHTVTNLGIFI